MIDHSNHSIFFFVPSRHASKPHWGETFKFALLSLERSLVVQVWDADELGADVLLGEVRTTHKERERQRQRERERERERDVAPTRREGKGRDRRGDGRGKK